MVSVVEAMVSGGSASAGPPLGPSLGPLGVNVKAIIEKINEQTAAFKGMQVPIKVIIDDKKQFTITVGTPPTSALIIKEAGIEKGSGTPNTVTVGQTGRQDRQNEKERHSCKIIEKFSERDRRFMRSAWRYL
jgi:large subunit ribosomal protein L11